MYEKTRFIPVGDRYINVEFGNAISMDIHRKVRGLFMALEQSQGEEVVELIPTYRSLLVEYNPLVISLELMLNRIRELEGSVESMDLPQPKVYRIPVVYGDEYGPDLDFVARHNGLSIEEVISIHSGRDYLIYMLGFTPGFCYLGGMSERIATPRLDEPRTLIPAGSVGIAGSQTGMYPIDSPGGWQLIGRTPVKLFDPRNERRPVLLQAGDYVRYQPISEEEYKSICRSVEENNGQAEYVEA